MPKIIISSKLSSTSAKAKFVEAPKKEDIGKVGIELDFAFDEKISSLQQLKARVTKEVKAAGVKAEVLPLNLEGPGGGNPNAYLAFSSLSDLFKFLQHYNGDDTETFLENLDTVVKH